jgi:hypothetical protein
MPTQSGMYGDEGKAVGLRILRRLCREKGPARAAHVARQVLPNSSGSLAILAARSTARGYHLFTTANYCLVGRLIPAHGGCSFKSPETVQ